MGLQGAGSYFQGVMSTVVLPRLIHQICELYLDDCIVPGQDEDSFVERLKEVFARFREFGITLYPSIKKVLTSREVNLIVSSTLKNQRLKWN